MSNKIYKSQQRGFTLVELQVAIVLLLIIFSLLAGVIFFASKAWKGSEEASLQQNQLMSVQQLLRRQLNSIVPLQKVERNKNLILFDGQGDQLFYISYLPEYLVRGGPWLIHLYIDDAKQLTLAYKAIDHNQSWQENKNDIFNHIQLIKHVDEFKISYISQKDVDKNDIWLETWMDKVFLPTLVKIEIKQKNNDWPQIIEPLHNSNSPQMPVNVLPQTN